MEERRVNGMSGRAGWAGSRARLEESCGAAAASMAVVEARSWNRGASAYEKGQGTNFLVRKR